MRNRVSPRGSSFACMYCILIVGDIGESNGESGGGHQQTHQLSTTTMCNHHRYHPHSWPIFQAEKGYITATAAATAAAATAATFHQP